MLKFLKKIMLFKISNRKINYSKLNPRNWKRPSIKKFFKNIAWVIIFLGAFIIVTEELIWYFDDYDWEDYDYENYIDEEECNVRGVELHGNLITYLPFSDMDLEGFPVSDLTSSDYVVSAIKQAEKDSDIKAIIFEVDSYGGSAVAAEEIANALKRAQKPTIAFIRDVGVSAAYLAATGADKIYASVYSDVGSIGVTMSYLDYTLLNQKEGVSYISLSSGKFKDTGDPDRPLSQEEKNLLMRDVDIMHENFVKAVAENRGLEIEKVKALADGSTMMGEMALEHGLIDQIGNRFDVEEYLKEKIGEEVEICWWF